MPLFIGLLKRSRNVTLVGTVCLSFVVWPSQRTAAEERRVDTGYSHQTAYASPDEPLDRLQDLFYRTLEACRVEFSGQTGFIHAFRAGSADYYPEVWVRDAATQIPATRYFYSRDYLTSWLEEILAHQQEDGALYDWVAPGPPEKYLSVAPDARAVYGRAVSADKNSMMADQEASAVDAAYQIAAVLGDRAWLAKPIKGKTLLQRLDLGLEYVLQKRFDAEHGLVKSGFAASWGDISPKATGKRYFYLIEGETPLVAALYTNTFFYHAVVELAAIHQKLGETTQANHWRKVAAGVKYNTNKYFWREDRGFYQTHLVLTPALTRGFPDESDIFDMPGNAGAALYGIADDRQARRIFEVAQERQRKYGMPTIAGVLLPPYPNGFFNHFSVNKQYTYLNGGQWDWFSARLLQAEFERGYTSRAYRQLIEIARQAVENDGLYEWYSKDGKGNGSPNYGDNAGTLGTVIFQDLFGVDLGGGTLNLRIRLGGQPGKIHLYQPTTDTYVAYQYAFDKAAATIRIDYQSNIDGPGRVSVLLPENRRTDKLLLDGTGKPFTVEKHGEDTFVSTSTDWKPHELKVILK
jgi:hypothetical protein